VQGEECTNSSDSGWSSEEPKSSDDEQPWDQAGIERQRWVKALQTYSHELETFKSSLKNGIDIVKHANRSSNQKLVTLWSTDEGRSVYYQSAGKPSLSTNEEKCIRIFDIIEIRCGLQTPALRRITDLLKSNKCFAIAVSKGAKGRHRKFFNFEAVDYASYKQLVIGFKLLKAAELYIEQ